MAHKIMIVRHAEKPEDPPAGVDITGAADKESLIPLGWQRAGALARLFYPWNAAPRTGLATPKSIFATKNSHHASDSLRPQETVTPTADLTGVQPDFTIELGSEPALATAVIAAKGPVLIGWQHQAIPDIANAILGDKTTAPQHWPGDRFDMVWVFDLGDGGAWTFSQVPQMLLAGDSPDPIPNDPKKDGA